MKNSVQFNLSTYHRQKQFVCRRLFFSLFPCISDLSRIFSSIIYNNNIISSRYYSFSSFDLCSIKSRIPRVIFRAKYGSTTPFQTLYPDFLHIPSCFVHFGTSASDRDLTGNKEMRCLTHRTRLRVSC